MSPEKPGHPPARVFAFALLLTLPAGYLNAEPSEEWSLEEGERIFALTVKSLLAEKCGACHGLSSGEKRKKPKADFDLSSRESLLRGGESGPGLVPGKSDESLLIRAVDWQAPGFDDADIQMPPKVADRLSAAEIQALRDWVDAGAPWPDDAAVEAIRERESKQVRMRTSGGLSKEWTDRRYDPEALWAYRPLARTEPPAGAAHPIDAFIDAKLAAAELAPAERAEARVLVRRLSYDLTGLPPSLDLLERYVAPLETRDEAAYRALVDELLESTACAEQSTRHWLDVVRYADSAGFSNDFERPNAWRYRDYVIRSFLNDKPYDQFVREQIAGDELDSKSTENLIAVGFLRMGPWEQTNMSVPKITRQQFLDDVTDAVGQTFLAQPLQCARCHDHKFDPVPTRDYYSVQAVFATTQFAEPLAPWLPDENRAGFEEKAILEKRLSDYRRELARISEKRDAAARAWYAERDLPYMPRHEALKKGLPEDQIVPARFGLDVRDRGLEPISRKNSTRHRWELDRYQPFAFSVYSGKTPNYKRVASRLERPKDPLAKGRLQASTILTGGDVFSPGKPVKPGVLSVLGTLETSGLTDEPVGRRLAFSRWLTDPENPLTPRVMVNRIWAWHFGRGLAGNPNNFGATGKRPSHPFLLDWLAREFVQSGWSVRHLRRLILCSDTYRRSARHPKLEDVRAADPTGTLYATFTPRRLAAEELRDAMLACSGELTQRVGGIPSRPDLHLEVALQPRMIMGTYAPAYQPNARPEDRNRRTLYALRLRGLRDPFLEVLNQPGPDKSCELREVSIVSPQALAMFHSDESRDRARAFAARLLREVGEDRGSVIQHAFLLAFGREPSQVELAEGLEHWRAMEAIESKRRPEPRTWPRVVERRAKEETTGEAFTFRETLEVYADYVPDLQASDVDAKTRALASLCLVYFNTNEFVYVE